MSRVFRIQDSKGRGPWRPGFSTMWLDDDIRDRAALPSIIEDFGHPPWPSVPPSAHVGTAVRSLDKLREWFTATERKRLAAYGFRIVSFGDATIARESPHQVLFWRQRPLALGATIRGWI